MSWQAYVDDQLVGTGRLQYGAIISAADGSAWALSNGFGLTADEGAAIVALFKNPADVFTMGVTVAGVKYTGIKADDRSIYGKKGATGVALAKTAQTIVIGYYNEKGQPGNAAMTVEKFADYLTQNQY
ncbi:MULTISPECIES: profilin [unclassified Streptomyces]|uniref:profilin n=1 Tax=unclassified Streptomyces TaxID=2593676 RepID=UPI0004C6B2FE|nr:MULTISPECIES: profilin [unclassified Streptomyces]KOX00260.1 hypothetical protein ADL02_03660 [Streptomyces sp. NRRL WC-3723]